MHNILFMLLYSYRAAESQNGTDSSFFFVTEMLASAVETMRVPVISWAV